MAIADDDSEYFVTEVQHGTEEYRITEARQEVGSSYPPKTLRSSRYVRHTVDKSHGILFIP